MKVLVKIGVGVQVGVAVLVAGGTGVFVGSGGGSSVGHVTVQEKQQPWQLRPS